MKIKSSEVGKLKEHPVLKDLSDELKDVDKYKPIEKDLRTIMISDHKHKTPKAFINCKRCKEKFDKRKKALKDYGFKDYQQYLMWRKVMEIISQNKDFQIL